MKPTSRGFIVIDTGTGAILSGDFKTRDKARAKLRELLESQGVQFDSTGRTSDPRARGYGVHQIMLYPHEVYDRATYRP